MLDFQYYSPTRVVFGRNAVKELGKLLKGRKKVLLHYGGGSVKKNGVFDAVVEQLDVGMPLCRLQQLGADFQSGGVLGMQNAAFAVAAFAPELKLAVLFLVKVHTPAEQLADGLRCLCDNGAHGGFIAEPGTGIQRVGDVFFKAVIFIHHRCDATLGFGGAGDERVALAENDHFTMFGGAQGKTEARHATADNEKVRCNHF